MSHAMPHKPACTAASVLLATSWLLSGAAASADLGALVVRVYDTTNATADIRQAAIRTAAAILEDAGIPVEWRDCTRASSESGCQNPPRRRDLIVRMVPAAKPNPLFATSSLPLPTSRSQEYLQLGSAQLDPVTLTGQLATIFLNQVRSVARRAGVDPAELLGRAVAHEIGHLLLRTRKHSATGLMREAWSVEDLSSNWDQDWRFAPNDRHRLRESVASSSE
jgi:hypothetical protein